VHANSAREALNKLCALPLLAGGNVDGAFVGQTVSACVDLVVHCEIDRNGVRRVREIATVTSRGMSPDVEIIFTGGPDGLMPTGARPSDMSKFERAGFAPDRLLGRAAC
jgi:pilus assembly protein CpaF